MIATHYELPSELRAQRVALVAAARARLTGSVPSELLPAASTVAAAPFVGSSSVRAGTARGVAVTHRAEDPEIAGSNPAEANARTTTRGKLRRSGSERRRSTTEAAGSTPAPRSGHATRAQITARSAECDEFVVRTYRELSAKEQAAQLGISREAVVMRRVRLDRAGRIKIKHHPKYTTWTEAEHAYLAAHIGRDPLERIAAALGRSIDAIKLERKRALIPTQRASRRGEGLLAATDVAEILGQDRHFVDRQIIAWGLLKARKVEFIGAGGHAKQWEIRREDLVDFLIDYPWQYDRARIRDPFFRRVADEAWSRDPLYTTVQAAKILGFHSRDAGGEGQHGVSSFLRWTAPKFLPRAKLVVRRKGNPRGSGRALAGMATFIPRSTIDAIQRSGWINVRDVVNDPTKLTARGAADLLWNDPDRPPYVSKTTLKRRTYRFMESGAIPTTQIRIPNRKPWRVAAPADVMALKETLFARASTTLRLTSERRGLIERHGRQWLKDPAELARGLADGRLATLFSVWYSAEVAAERERKWKRARRFALVTRHVARTLEHIGPRTKLWARGRGARYHLQRCTGRLVEIPLSEARRRGLRVCGRCDFERKRPRARARAA